MANVIPFAFRGELFTGTHNFASGGDSFKLALYTAQPYNTSSTVYSATSEVSSSSPYIGYTTTGNHQVVMQLFLQGQLQLVILLMQFGQQLLLQQPSEQFTMMINQINYVQCQILVEIKLVLMVHLQLLSLVPLHRQTLS